MSLRMQSRSKAQAFWSKAVRRLHIGWSVSALCVAAAVVLFASPITAVAHQLSAELLYSLETSPTMAGGACDAGADDCAVATDRWSIAKRYVALGIEHIVPLGWDHILFILCLFLFSRSLWQLLQQVTAFTAAHTITLTLAAAGMIQPPSDIVEPLIALSIAYVAVENARASHRVGFRTAIVFGFGLLHGMGFASVLLDLGIPEAYFLTCLLSFNVGVELGQLFLILVSWLALRWFFHKAWYTQRIVVPASIVIAAIGSYWTMQRIVDAVL
jgi:hypothetical protein